MSKGKNVKRTVCRQDCTSNGLNIAREKKKRRQYINETECLKEKYKLGWDGYRGGGSGSGRLGYVGLGQVVDQVRNRLGRVIIPLHICHMTFQIMFFAILSFWYDFDILFLQHYVLDLWPSQILSFQHTVLRTSDIHLKYVCHRKQAQPRTIFQVTWACTFHNPLTWWLIIFWNIAFDKQNSHMKVRFTNQNLLLVVFRSICSVFAY
jgi:hypothetical protein